ncbi:MAG: hypothetical protein ACLFV0_05925, partial [Nitriliruptoraceae bacterium]
AAVAAPVPGHRLPALLAATPPGWQQRVLVRHLLAGPGVTAPVPVEVLEVLPRAGDRFAIAARLTRLGLLDPTALEGALPATDLDRLYRRARSLGRVG